VPVVDDVNPALPSLLRGTRPPLAAAAQAARGKEIDQRICRGKHSSSVTNASINSKFACHSLNQFARAGELLARPLNAAFDWTGSILVQTGFGNQRIYAAIWIPMVTSSEMRVTNGGYGPVTTADRQPIGTSTKKAKRFHARKLPKVLRVHTINGSPPFGWSRYPGHSGRCHRHPLKASQARKTRIFLLTLTRNRDRCTEVDPDRETAGAVF
jgi:hypothetical protein